MFSASGRSAAIDLLEQISRREFATNVEDNFLHRSWLKRWLTIVPAYIDWQIERAPRWRVLQVEAAQARKSLTGTLTIAGRIDRIDTGANGTAIIDYKTGNTPSQDDILSGESVQLPFYGLLADGVPARAEFVRLGDAQNRVTGSAVLEGVELRDTMQRNQQRLSNTWQALQDGTPLPAWGDDRTCAWCTMQGICRRQTWETTGAPDSARPDLA
jgi:ATP-dependent helicase/nuclease subunit B